MASCTTASYCLPLTVKVEQDEFSADPGWVAGAFVLGLILGAGIAGLCVRPCLREWEKKKRQDAEKGNIANSHLEPVVTKQIKDDEKNLEKKKVKKKKGGRFKRRGGDDEEEDDDVDYKEKVQERMPELSKGMVDIMAQTESNSAEIEIASQDLETVTAIENRQRKEKQTLYVQLLAILLRKDLDRKKITTSFYDGFLHKTRIEMADQKKIMEREKAEKEQELRDDVKLSKNPEAFESELQKVQTEHNNKLNHLDKEYRDKIRQDLMRSSGLSDAEVEIIMEKLANQLAAFEKKKTLEQARQRRSLEDRLAKRKQFVEYRTMLQQEEMKDIESQTEAFDELLTKYVEDNKLVERQKDDLLKQYQQNLQDLHHNWNKENLRQQLSLAEKLRLRRLKRCCKLSEKQMKEEAILMKTAEKSTSTADFLEVYSDMITKQHIELEDLGSELDLSETQELENLKKDTVKSLTDVVSQEEEKMAGLIGEEAKLTRKEVEKVLIYYRKQLELYNLKKQHEKQAMISRLQQKLAQRMMKLEEEEQLERAEEQKLRNQQSHMLEMAISSNIELTQEAKQKVLDQHDQNMEALNNQLQQSKLRQMKSLELKLCQRRTKLAELEKKEADIRHHPRDMSSKERDKLLNKLDTEISEEEKKLKEHREKAIEDLKRQLAAETEEALKLQEEEVGQLIGRLQVGQARRKAILLKQDRTLQELQDQLERKVIEGGDLPKTMTDQLIQEHYNQVSYLNQQIQRTREEQEETLREKIQAKKYKRERELEEQLEDEAEEEFKMQSFHGKGFASHVLTKSLLEQRHRKMMGDLEQEMKAELQKNRDDINQQMEAELQTELKSQKQQLLTQLAAISNLSPSEIQNVVEHAVIDSGESEKTAKKLVKDLRQEIKRAKTSLGMEEEEEDYGYQRSRSDIGSLQYGDATELTRSTKSKQKRFSRTPKPAYYDEESEDEDAF
ncbi:hypothetical protein SNE40_008377 [Patella caerulea]|uniref:Uncharacterized protein n=1 Tax=Patella caerulea TaxID=87958 RepID=A0AAN8JVG5_PATCE